MPWKWYSYNDFVIPDFIPTDDQLIASFKLLINTANVHDGTNFPDRPLSNYVEPVRQKVTDGDVVMAFGLSDAATPVLNRIICFQRARQKFGNPDGIVPDDEEAWVVSYGFDQDDEVLFNGNSKPATCKAHTNNHLTPQLDKFIRKFGVTYLYSAEQSDPGNEPLANSLKRKIGRLQTYSNGDKWFADLTQTKKVTGTENYHLYWGQPDNGEYTFYVTQIERL